jgi:hypothetical protein
VARVKLRAHACRMRNCRRMRRAVFAHRAGLGNVSVAVRVREGTTERLSMGVSVPKEQERGRESGPWVVSAPPAAAPPPRRAPPPPPPPPRVRTQRSVSVTQRALSVTQRVSWRHPASSQRHPASLLASPREGRSPRAVRSSPPPPRAPRPPSSPRSAVTAAPLHAERNHGVHAHNTQPRELRFRFGRGP